MILRPAGAALHSGRGARPLALAPKTSLPAGRQRAALRVQALGSLTPLRTCAKRLLAPSGGVARARRGRAGALVVRSIFEKFSVSGGGGRRRSGRAGGPRRAAGAPQLPADVGARRPASATSARACTPPTPPRPAPAAPPQPPPAGALHQGGDDEPVGGQGARRERGARGWVARGHPRRSRPGLLRRCRGRHARRARRRPRTLPPPSALRTTPQVTTQHVLLGLIAEDDASKRGYLNSGLTHERALAAVEALSGRRKANTATENIPFSREVRKTFEVATNVREGSGRWGLGGAGG
jgi:hypothetical protein